MKFGISLYIMRKMHGQTTLKLSLYPQNVVARGNCLCVLCPLSHAGDHMFVSVLVFLPQMNEYGQYIRLQRFKSF